MCDGHTLRELGGGLRRSNAPQKKPELVLIRVGRRPKIDVSALDAVEAKRRLARSL